MFIQIIFSNRLKALRTERNVSQEELGSVIGVSKAAISDIERLRRTTTIDKLVAIADYFNVSLDYLIGRSDDPSLK